MTTSMRWCAPLLLGFAMTGCAEANEPATNDPAALGSGPAAAAPESNPGAAPAGPGTAPPAQNAAGAAPPVENAGQGTLGAAEPASAAPAAASPVTAGSPATVPETADTAVLPTEPVGEVDGVAGACNTTDFTPKCDLTPTAAGAEIKKGTACTEADPQCCFRTCGPQSIGWKTETCIAGAYEEGDCQFPPDADYSCYAVPEQIDATVCPQDAPPQAGQECDVAECTLCNLDDTYLDSGGSSKVGYCVCQAPNGDGKRTWSCGSTTAWPCPLGQGC